MRNEKSRKQKMIKVKVGIEEHLTRLFEIEVPADLVKNEDTGAILDAVAAAHDRGEIVLTADDYQGVRLYRIAEDGPLETEWEEF